jgi:acetate kinase
VFTGGIGAHAADIRAAICAPLAHLGISLAGERNAVHAAVVSSGRCEVRVVVADEEQVIARHTRRLAG